MNIDKFGRFNTSRSSSTSKQINDNSSTFHETENLKQALILLKSDLVVLTKKVNIIFSEWPEVIGPKKTDS